MTPDRVTLSLLADLCERWGATHWRGRKVVLGFPGGESRRWSKRGQPVPGERVVVYADTRRPVTIERKP